MRPLYLDLPGYGQNRFKRRSGKPHKQGSIAWLHGNKKKPHRRVIEKKAPTPNEIAAATASLHFPDFDDLPLDLLPSVTPRLDNDSKKM